MGITYVLLVVRQSESDQFMAYFACCITTFLGVPKGAPGYSLSKAMPLLYYFVFGFRNFKVQVVYQKARKLEP